MKLIQDLQYKICNMIIEELEIIGVGDGGGDLQGNGYGKGFGDGKLNGDGSGSGNGSGHLSGCGDGSGDNIYKIGLGW